MQIPGRLESTTLGDVLGQLHRGRTTGTLSLHEESGPDAGARHRVVLSRGLVAEVCTSGGPLLGELLEAEGLLPQGAAGRLVRVLRAGERSRLGELLVRSRVVDADRLRGVLRRQTLARLEELFDIERARLSFHVLGARASPGNGSTSAPALHPREFLHGRLRSRDSRVEGGSIDAGGWSERGAQDPRTRALSALGLGRDAAPAEIRHAFRRLAAQAHPDRGARCGEARGSEQRFVELSVAYHTLMA